MYIYVYISIYIHADIDVYIHTYLYTYIHYITWHDMAWHYNTLHYITLHFTSLHYTALHYTTLHTYICIYICVFIFMYTYIFLKYVCRTCAVLISRTDGDLGRLSCTRVRSTLRCRHTQRINLFLWVGDGQTSREWAPDTQRDHCWGFVAACAAIPCRIFRWLVSLVVLTPILKLEKQLLSARLIFNDEVTVGIRFFFEINSLL